LKNSSAIPSGVKSLIPVVPAGRQRRDGSSGRGLVKLLVNLRAVAGWLCRRDNWAEHDSAR
jgi:hypothetical protein